MSDYPAYQAPVDIPVCPRHPDRESHVRCQRCRRPVCPECQRPAAVGVQCVDCVREAARATPVTRSQFGGLVDGGRAGRVTYVLIGVCAVLWVGELLQPSLVDSLSLVPYYAWDEPWRFLTGSFLHSPSSIFHILFNMFVLWQIGPYLEQLLGRLRFALLYLVSALGGSAGVVLLAAAPAAGTSPSVATAVATGWFTPVVGASGAVFGLFAALLVLNRHLGRNTAGIGVVVLLNAVIGFVVPGIAWQAHLGGFVAGLAGAGVIAGLNRQHLRRYAPAALVAVLAVVVLLTVAKYLTVAPFYR
jgi:membrane associated rhomboid family serine protease